MTTKTLVIGEAPSRWMRDNGISAPLPLARRELAALAGITPMRFDELFECVNVLSKWPGKQGKGDAFPLDLARPAAWKMMEGFQGRRVILLGSRVAKAFGIEIPPLTFSHHEAFEVAICPHPSGVNTWWNKPENRIAARMFWGGLVT